MTIPYGNLDAFLGEVYSRLTPEDVFTGGHDWKTQNSDKWRGTCPWHESKSGSSFYILPNQGLFWYCTGCCVGGGPIQYLHKLKFGRDAASPRNEQFWGYMTELAEKAGLEVPRRNIDDADKKLFAKIERRREMINAVLRYAEAHLWDSDEGKVARDYLNDRGLTDEEIKAFGLGLCPKYDDDFEVLRVCLGFSEEEMIEVGLLHKGRSKQGDRPYTICPLSGYITVPWYEANGKILTVYGRYPGSPPSSRPKTVALRNPGGNEGYLNSKHTPLGLHLARQHGIKDLTVVEGVFDYLIAQAKGDHSVIAFVSNKPSQEQLEAIQRYNPASVTLCLDPDTGGSEGTKIASRKIMARNIPVFVCPTLPGEQDPDEFITSKGLPAWEAFKSQKSNALRWEALRLIAYHQRSGGYTDEARSALAKDIREFLGHIKNTDLIEYLDTYFWQPITEATDLKPIPLNQVEQVVEEVSKSSQLRNSKLTPEEATIAVRAVLEACYSRAVEEAKLEEIRLQSNYAPNRFYEYVEDERKIIAADPQTFMSITDKLYALSKTQVNLARILPLKLAASLMRTADINRVDPAFHLQFFWAACAVMIGNKSRLVVRPATTSEGAWKEPAIVWTIVVAHSGTGKTPAQRTVFSPIYGKQKRLDEQYREREMDYQRKLEAWKGMDTKNRKELKGSEEEPGSKLQEVGVWRKLIFDIGQLEAVLRRLADQEQEQYLTGEDILSKGSAGSVWLRDELIGLFSGLDQYKSGKGDSMPILLSMWNGDRTSVDRVKLDDTYVIQNPCLSIAGGTQPAKLGEIFQDANDSDGAMARFLMAMPVMLPDDFSWVKEGTDTVEVLGNLYDDLENMTLGDIHFSEAAEVIWAEFYKDIKILWTNEYEDNPALGNFLAKCFAHCARLALILHHVEHAYSPKQDPTTLSADTLRRAIYSVNYYIGQFQLLQSLATAKETPGDSLLSLHQYAENYASKHGKGLPVQVVSSSKIAKDYKKSTRKTLSQGTIREWFEELARIGYGTTEGEGGKMVYNPRLGKEILGLIESRQRPTSNLDPTAQALMEKLDRIDDVSPVETIPGVDGEVIPAPVEYKVGDLVLVGASAFEGLLEGATDADEWEIIDSNDSGKIKVICSKHGDTKAFWIDRSSVIRSAI